MGQISLPRFNRLNISMTWESMLNTNQYHWLSTKIYLFLQLYISNIFKVTQYNFFNLWGYKLKINMFFSLSISNFIKKHFLTKNFLLAVIPNSKQLLNILGLYIVRLFDKSYIYLVYNHYNSLKSTLNILSTFSSNLFYSYLTNFKLYLLY